MSSVHRYVVETDERENVIFRLALLSVLVTLIATSLLHKIPYIGNYVGALSVMIVFGLVY